MTISEKRSWRWLSAALLYAACCAGQTSSSAHSVSGQVIDSVTGEPIARALVQLGPLHAALTDHEGRFQFDDVVNDESPPQASKPGYFPGNSSVSRSRPGTVELVPEAILSGTVLDDAGHPVQDLHLELKKLQVRNGRAGWQQMNATITNVEGEFRFAELQAGEYRLVTNYQVEGLPEAPSSLAFLPVTYPAPTGDQAGGALTLAPGNHVEANLNVSADNVYPVTGVVSGPMNQGVGFNVETADGEIVNAMPRVYPESGAFRLMVPSGSYRLTVRSFGQPQQLIGTREVSVGHAPLQGVSISLAPAAQFPVEVEYQVIETASRTSPEEEPQNNTRSVYVALQDEDRTRTGEYPAAPVREVHVRGGRAAADPEIPRVIANVPPGRYHLSVQANPPWYVAAASCGDLDLMRNPLVIAEDSGACTIRVVVRNDSSTLKWSVAAADGEPSRADGPVFVAAIPLGNLTLADATGTFTPEATGGNQLLRGLFPNLAPGRYLVLALPHPEEIPFRDPEAVQKYLPLGQEVTLERNSEAEVQLRLTAAPAGELK